jgi:hypothetical protein
MSSELPAARGHQPFHAVVPILIAGGIPFFHRVPGTGRRI